MRLMIADIKGGDGFVSKDTVVRRPRFFSADAGRHQTDRHGLGFAERVAASFASAAESRD
jgi:hypothetical protein